MSPVHDEKAFGSAIVAALLTRGWREANPEDYTADLGLDTNELFTFIGATQHDEWYELANIYGGQAEAQRGFARRLDQAITEHGVLRDGVKDRGVKLHVAYFKPNLVADPAILAPYRANRLTVVRELPYATKQADWGHRLDLTLFLNGIPLATAELKNPLPSSASAGGQSVRGGRASCLAPRPAPTEKPGAASLRYSYPPVSRPTATTAKCLRGITTRSPVSIVMNRHNWCFQLSTVPGAPSG